VLYYLLTERPPFVAESLLDALLLVLEAEAVRPRAHNHRAPVESGRICLRCLEKSPERRYATAGEVAEDLERFLKGEPLAMQPSGLQNRFATWVRRQPALASRVCAAATCGIISETGYRLSGRIPAEQHVAIIAVLGYGLLLAELHRRGSSSVEPHWHWAAVAVLFITGFIVVSLVHRVGALSRFQESRRQSLP
jgi:serine/threonine-protein kinase